MRNKKFSVIIPSIVYPKPSPEEISAAYILADYFQADVKFVPRNNRKTPDFLIKALNICYQLRRERKYLKLSKVGGRIKLLKACQATL